MKVDAILYIEYKQDTGQFGICGCIWTSNFIRDRRRCGKVVPNDVRGSYTSCLSNKRRGNKQR